MRNLPAVLIVAVMAAGIWACGGSSQESRTATATPATSILASPPQVGLEDFRTAWNASVRMQHADSLVIQEPLNTTGQLMAFRHEFSNKLMMGGQLDSGGRFLRVVGITWLSGGDLPTLTAATKALPYAVDPGMDPTGEDEVLFHLGFLSPESNEFATTARYNGIEYRALQQPEGYFQVFFYKPH